MRKMNDNIKVVHLFDATQHEREYTYPPYAIPHSFFSLKHLSFGQVPVGIAAGLAATKYMNTDSKHVMVVFIFLVWR